MLYSLLPWRQKVAHSSDILKIIYQTTWRQVPEDNNNLQGHRRENLKSPIMKDSAAKYSTAYRNSVKLKSSSTTLICGFIDSRYTTFAIPRVDCNDVSNIIANIKRSPISVTCTSQMTGMKFNFYDSLILKIQTRTMSACKSSTFRTLGTWFRILHEAWICLNYCVECGTAQAETLRRADPSSKEPYYMPKDSDISELILNRNMPNEPNLWTSKQNVPSFL
jgi:hypothetical protein